MRAAFALRIVRGKSIYDFAILENLRIFQNCLFTGGVVTANGIESPLSVKAQRCRGANSPSLATLDSPLWDGAFVAWRQSFRLKHKVCGFARGSPFEERPPPLRGKMSHSDKRGNLAR